MTGVERHRRHLCTTAVCQICKGDYETIMHVLRDCPAISGVWNRLVPTSYSSSFFASTILEWLYENLRNDSEVSGVPWSTLFAVTVWWGWKWRCGNIFGTNNRCRDRVKFLKDLGLEVYLANKRANEQENRVVRVERLIHWTPPRESWFKLNTDGASHGNPGLATAGGVLRDVNGNWCGGFSLNIGICTAPLAELWGVYYGLYIAWEKRITRLELEIDSEIVVGFLKTVIGDSHPLSFHGCAMAFYHGTG